MSRYKAYAEYKDSEINWLGKIPKDWLVVALKRVCKFSTGLTPPTDNQDNYSDEISNFPWIRPEDLDESGSAVHASKYLSETGWRYIRRVPQESTLICCIGTIGKIGFLKGIAATNQQITAATFKYAPRFNFYLIQSARKILEESATGNVIQILNSERLGNIPFLSVPNDVANKIANFLDHETAKIDTLIAKQQELIKLLKEKRQAVISHAVTKGLNPNVPMRNSGVEWLGEVPEHWEVKKFNHCASIRNGQVDPTVYPYKGYILIAPNHIESGTGKIIGLETAEEQGADSGKYLCQKGEVIYSKIRPALAKVCISPGDETICSADMYPIQGENGLTNDFLFYSLLSNWFTSFVILESDRVAMPKINREKLSEIKMAFPNSDEQRVICDEIRQRVSTIDSLLENTEKSIALAQERRTALISAAVTGKIDVRDWQRHSLSSLIVFD